jgi:hypothetical protein
LLVLLAARPRRLTEIDHVWETGNLPPRVTNDYHSFAVAMNDSLPAVMAN